MLYLSKDATILGIVTEINLYQESVKIFNPSLKKYTTWSIHNLRQQINSGRYYYKSSNINLELLEGLYGN